MVCLTFIYFYSIFKNLLTDTEKMDLQKVVDMSCKGIQSKSAEESSSVEDSFVKKSYTSSVLGNRANDDDSFESQQSQGKSLGRPKYSRLPSADRPAVTSPTTASSFKIGSSKSYIGTGAFSQIYGNNKNIFI
jgi:hypothetical protein